MTWEPRNKTGDDLDDVSVDEYEDKDDEDQKDGSSRDGERNGSADTDRKESSECNVSEAISTKINSEPCSDNSSSKDGENQSIKLSVSDQKTDENTSTIEKPKIWSLARTATSESPPISRKHPLENPSQEEFKRFRRMYADNFNNEECDPRLYLPHRNIPRLHPDSSAESSLSSPPSWRTSEHPLNHTDKYGRVTPLDSSDVVSVSPSSSDSPAIIVSSAADQLNASSPSMAYSRFLGCRLFSCTDSSASGLRPPTDHSQYYTSQSSPITHSLDLRTYHTSFLKAPPFGHPSGFSVPPIPHPSMQQTLPTSIVNKGKPENGNHSQSDR